MNKPKYILLAILFLAAILRFWQLGSVPVSLFGDEVDIAYHAQSILKTGKDYSGNFALFYVQSIGDKKAPLYTYSLVPSIAVFGMSPFSVRLPAAIFGILGILFFYLLTVELTKNKNLSLVGALLLSFSPWHIHYSRWGFEGNLMILLFLIGLYLFLKSFNNNKLLLPSALAFSLTPYAYHSAKVFLPLMLIAIGIIFRKEIKAISKGKLISSFLILIVLAGSLIFNTIFGSSGQRFEKVSIFTDPKNEGEIGLDRIRDEKMGFSFGNIFHNNFTLLFDKISNNYLQTFSTEFLFIRGDTNPRHSVLQSGEFYKFQFVFLILGIIFLATKPFDKKAKILIISWLLLAPAASIITYDGGNHASRLLFMLQPLIFLIALGVYYTYLYLKPNLKKIYLFLFGLIFIISFIFYQHIYYVHYPIDSERWWQAGFREAIQSVLTEGKNYNKVIITGGYEPALMFFLAFSQYPPQKFQKEFPLKEEELPNFGKVGVLDKYYFSPIGRQIGLYELGAMLPDNSIYLASMNEVKLNLINEPERVPSNLKLIKSFTYPSGEPVFYIFTKNDTFKKI